MMVPLEPRGFWLPASIIGIIVCGAFTLTYLLEPGYHKETLLFGFCTGANVWTLLRAKRSSGSNSR